MGPRSSRTAQGPMLYFGRVSVRPRIPPGGAAIGDVLRQAWSRLIRKQWLILYPFVLSIVGTLAFFAVYAADGKRIGLAAFLNADFNRWDHIWEQFFTDFSLTPQLAVAIVVGLVYCAIAAMVQAPFYRAIAGSRYPLAPRGWAEAGRLFVFYLILYAATRMLPLVAASQGLVADLVLIVVTIFALAVVFTDYVIVFEDVGVARGIRRSLRLLTVRFPVVLLVFIVLELLFIGVRSLYGLYYQDTSRVFILLPISRMVVESLVLLLGNLVLVFLYEDTRRQSPA